MTTYAVLSRNGTVIARDLSAADAAHTLLTDDGQEYEIRPDDAGNGYDLWTRQQVAGKDWTRTSIGTAAQDADEAEAEIFAQVVERHRC